MCKAVSHNSALLATDEPTPCANAATCFHEPFQDFPLGLHNWAGCWILGNHAEGLGGRGTDITQHSTLEAEGKWEEFLPVLGMRTKPCL